MNRADELRTREFSRILLIKPSALGDVIHTIPVLVKLRARYPRARIDWFITPENADIVRSHPALSNTVIFARREYSGFGWKAAAGLLRLIARLRGGHYDLVIDLHGQFRSVLFGLAACAPVRLGFDRPVRVGPGDTAEGGIRNASRAGWKGAREGSWFTYTHRIPIPTLEEHAIDRYLWMGDMLGFDKSPPDSTIYLPAETAGRVEALFARHGVEGSKPLAALVPGTIWETKHWPPARFAEVARHLLAAGHSVVLLGTRRDGERCREIAAAAPGARDLSGGTNPADLAGIIQRSAICVTNDSGSMHLAVALGRPVVSVFGPTNPVHIGPYGHPESVVRVDLPCSPCNFRKLAHCPHSHACMEQVTAAMVIERIGKVAGRAGA